VPIADFGGAHEHGVRFSSGDAGRAVHALAEIGELIESGRFSLPVAQTFPLAEIAAAHRSARTVTYAESSYCSSAETGRLCPRTSPRPGAVRLPVTRQRDCMLGRLWSVTSFILSVIAVVVASASAAYTRKQAVQAAKVTAIEQGRRHDELTPEFEVTCSVPDAAAGSADLRVTLTGGGLDYLDEVVITILDEAGRDHWAHGLPEGVTQEQAEAFVWGPWKFNTGAGAQVITSRETRPRAYSRVSGKNWDVLSLTATRPGHWMTGTTQDIWRKQHQDHPVRLLITCRRDGYEPWFVSQEVNPARPKVARARFIT
jgi:hypothetical protein